MTVWLRFYHFMKVKEIQNNANVLNSSSIIVLGNKRQLISIPVIEHFNQLKWQIFLFSFYNTPVFHRILIVSMKLLHCLQTISCKSFVVSDIDNIFMYKSWTVYDNSATSKLHTVYCTEKKMCISKSKECAICLTCETIHKSQEM